MTPERWQEVKKVLAGALERTPEERRVYLDQACTEPELRREVESLIAAHEQGDNSFMEQPALNTGSLQSGTKLGPYTILRRIGVGGMGEVYRAHDPKLKRDVAIKVLPAAFGNDPGRLARFQREARLLASLNHPNIASIYGLEDSGSSHALVMELAEGPTLADRIGQGPIPIDEALAIAKQMAEALEYAHERGIVHRDLKPANVKVASDDTVKILDFGLAKALETDPHATDLANSPTISQMATEAGVLLGTAAYMSPEQAKAKPVDRRADIWAFGCVLYEMLTGKMTFRGESVTDTLAAVLKNDPDWSQLPAATPPHVRVLLRRCLQKEARQRLQAIGDARIALDEVVTGASEPSVTSEISAPLWRRGVPWALFCVTAAALAAFAWLHEAQLRTAVPAEPVKLQIPLPMKPPLRFGGLFALSPDGRQLAFIATSADGISRIWVRALNSLEMRPLPGTESVGPLMFWSPDSRFIAFGASGKLQKINISGGPAETVCVLNKLGVGGSWSRDGVIIFGQFLGTLMRVSAAGGVATPLTALDASHGDIAHTVPWFLPDGRHFLYVRDRGLKVAISLGSLDAKAEEQDSGGLVEPDASVAYVPSPDSDTGQLLFLRGGTLMAQPFDTRRLELSGEPVRVMEEPVGSLWDHSLFSVSANRTLAYMSQGNVDSQLTWFDAQGKILSTVGEPGRYDGLFLSPDGTRALVSKRTPPNWKVALWLLDLSRGTSTVFELGPSRDDAEAVWAPDERRVIFGSDRADQMDLYEKPMSGAEDAEALLKSNEWKIPSSWSPDGRFLLYTSMVGETKGDLWVLPLGDHKKPIPFLRTEFDEGDGHFSPDGRWVAYASDESGRYEVYVRPFSPDASREAISDAGNKRLISSGGGYLPIWRGDGKELYYIGFDGKLMAVKLTTGPAFQAGVPRVLFQAPPRIPSTVSVTQWGPSADGKRFLFLVPETQDPAPFTVVLNWQSALKK
jgi:Tol biopolymer transport system component